MDKGNKTSRLNDSTGKRFVSPSPNNTLNENNQKINNLKIKALMLPNNDQILNELFKIQKEFIALNLTTATTRPD